MPISKSQKPTSFDGAYANRTHLDCGAVVVLGSDRPVETLEPLTGIHAAVTRCRADGAPEPEGWHSEQRLTVEQAAWGYTAGRFVWRAESLND